MKSRESNEVGRSFDLSEQDRKDIWTRSAQTFRKVVDQNETLFKPGLVKRKIFDVKCSGTEPIFPKLSGELKHTGTEPTFPVFGSDIWPTLGMPPESISRLSNWIYFVLWFSSNAMKI